MGRQLDENLREVWRKRIERQQRGGLSVAEACRGEGVSTASFYAWRRRLGMPRSRGVEVPNGAKAGKPRGRRGPGNATRRRRPMPSGPAPQAAFVQLPVPGVPGSPWVEVVLAEGAVIRIPQQNLAALETVLGMLKGAASTPATKEVRYA